MKTLNIKTVDSTFFEPLQNAVDCVRTRNCKELSGSDFVKNGVLRVLEHNESGRAFFQKRFPSLEERMGSLRNYYGSNQSSRRCEFLEKVQERLCASSKIDLLQDIPELKNWEVVATDAHQVEHACHAGKDTNGNYLPAKTNFSLNLRTGMLSVLAACGSESKREHEVVSFRKNCDNMQLRKGFRVLDVVDRGYLDGRFWLEKSRSGRYMVSRTKDNFAWVHVAPMDDWDKSDERNANVEKVECVGQNGVSSMRLITCICPFTGEKIQILTTDFSLPPGVIAYVYFLRWQIEKVFDVSKNRFFEQKAWSKDKTAYKTQCLFICITWNLLSFFLTKIETEEGIRDEKVIRKHNRRIEELLSALRSAGGKISTLFLRPFRPSQPSCQFLRWLIHQLRVKNPWANALAELKPLMLNYIQ